MTKVLVTQSKLDTLAEIVGGKSNTNVPLTVDEMITAADSITSGGGGTPTLETITKTYTPSTSAVTDTITPSSGYDGIEEVDVTVSAVPSAYVYPNYYANYTTQNNVRKWWVEPNAYVDVAGWVNDGDHVGNKVYYNAIAAGTTITPSTSSQTIGGANYMMEDAVTVSAMPSGSVTAPASISGSSASVSTGTNTLTLSKTISVTPNVTTAGYVSSGTAGNSNVSLTASVTTQGAQTLHPSTTDQTITGSKYLTGTQTFKAVTTSNLTADNIKSGVTVKIGDSTDDDCVASVTGTYSGGGSSKNVQVLQSTSRTNSSSLTKVLGDLTVSKTGTYDVYWSGGRTNTSTSYTWGTRLYVDGSGYGTENTTWTNNCQSNHLSNVSLTANQKLSIYARGRSGSYYTFAPMLVIIES